MITDGRLREAAARTCEDHIAGLLAGYDPEYRCQFSPGFERKIDRLRRRADHPVFYRTMRRIAMLLLALLVAGTVWIAVNADARAAFFGWVGNFIGGYYVFHHEAEPDGGAEPADYRPAWIPEGYAEESVRVMHEKTVVRYLNGEGLLLRFNYVHAGGDADWFFDVSKGSTRACRGANSARHGLQSSGFSFHLGEGGGPLLFRGGVVYSPQTEKTGG